MRGPNWQAPSACTTTTNARCAAARTSKRLRSRRREPRVRDTSAGQTEQRDRRVARPASRDVLPEERRGPRVDARRQEDRMAADEHRLSERVAEGDHVVEEERRDTAADRRRAKTTRGRGGYARGATEKEQAQDRGHDRHQQRGRDRETEKRATRERPPLHEIEPGEEEGGRHRVVVQRAGVRPRRGAEPVAERCRQRPSPARRPIEHQPIQEQGRDRGPQRRR